MRTAFYISDGTAITSEVFGHALLSLFPTEFEHQTIPFVESVEKALEVKEKINKTPNFLKLQFLTLSILIASIHANNFVYDICRFINRQMSIYYNAFILALK